MRRLSASICLVLLLGAAARVVAREPWHGPIILSLSSEHGIDAGDFLAFPLRALAIAVARRQARRRVPNEEPRLPSGAGALPASAIVLGALLLFAGVVAKAGGGPLVPTGGATL